MQMDLDATLKQINILLNRWRFYMPKHSNKRDHKYTEAPKNI